MTRFDVFFVASLTNLLNKWSRCQLFETPWRSYDVVVECFNGSLWHDVTGQREIMCSDMIFTSAGFDFPSIQLATRDILSMSMSVSESVSVSVSIHLHACVCVCVCVCVYVHLYVYIIFLHQIYFFDWYLMFLQNRMCEAEFVSL